MTTLPTHSAKFPEAFVKATGRESAPILSLKKLQTMKTACTRLDADSKLVKQYILSVLNEE